MDPIKNRSEILFLYDVTFANPNGDPVDENKPRIDEETGRNIVTDVRLKRTVRDYLKDYKGKEIFIVEKFADETAGTIQDAKRRAEDFLIDNNGNVTSKDKVKSLAEMKKIIDENILRCCIDVRLFGVTLPVEKNKQDKGSITHTGPVQFRMGKSLHKVSLQYIKGTGAFASGENLAQKTFREEYILPYSLICFYGIANENAAKETRLTEEDMSLLLDALWNGTKNLISRSKAGQMPRVLLRVVYKEGNYHIGDLDKMVTLSHEKADEALRDISDVQIDFTQLVNAISKNVEKIDRIEYKVDDRVKLISEGKESSVSNLFSGLQLNEIPV